MKPVILFFILFLIFANRVDASHIVGGEFYLIHKTDNKYELGLNMYYDELNSASASLKNDFIRATIFRKKDNQFMANVDLGYYKNQSLIAYKNPNCKQYNLVKTTRLYYYTEITLSSDTYNDPEGYYVSWERCCRNANINNIAFPDEVGNVFYMEFPAVTSNNKSFINSSPQFNVITGDYACVNTPFYFDFGGTDADGDSLVYSIVTPYKGYSVLCDRFCSCPDNCAYPANPLVATGPNTVAISPNPRNHPAPYTTITWSTGYSLNKSTPGPQPLRVNPKTGVISFTTNMLGLYAFAVLCEEYRNGVRIGAVQRDFQIKVIDCPKNFAPTINLKTNDTKQFASQNSTIQVLLKDSLCFEVDLNDIITGTSDSLTGSFLNAMVIAQNFDQSLVAISPSSGTVLKDSDTLKAKLCFSKCAAAEKNQPLKIQLIVFDNGCGSGISDTLSLAFNFELLNQEPPVITTTLPGNNTNIFVGQTVQFVVNATNPEKGEVSISGAGRGFEMKNVGMQFENKTGVDTVSSPFKWTPDCTDLGIVKDNTFIIDFFTENKNCKNKYDTTTVTIVVQDSVVSYDFLPANVFTPNGDKINDYYEMSGNIDVERNLPKDNCAEQFDKIEIYNRWGKIVYKSNNRDFKWSASGFPTGNYYYLIYYTTRRYKGWVSIVK